MIKVEIKLYATLRSYHPQVKAGEPLHLNLKEGTTAGQLLEKELGISTNVVKIVFVNSIARRPDYVLANGDRVGIFPPIAGG